ncbi:MAG: hypothetical protein ACR2QO_27345 [Acidimicrobiales bacterium]
MTTSEEPTSVQSDDQLLAELERLRADNDALVRQLEEKTAGTDAPWWRHRWLSIGAAILAGIVLPLAVISVWARNTLLDTDQYVATISPLVDNEDIQEAVSFRVTEAVSEEVGFKAIAEDVLPANAQVLAGPIEAGAKSVIAELASSVVASPTFAQIWQEANREAHQNVVPLITGDNSGVVDVEDGRVVVPLGDVADDVVGRLDERLGADLSAQLPEEGLDAEIVLIESQELADAQTGARWLDRLRWVFVFLAAAFGIGAVAMSEHRRLGVRRLGITIFVSMLLMVLLYSFFRNQYMANLPEGVHNADAAVAAFDIVTAFLQRSLRSLLTIGALVLVGTWVVGPSSSAVRVRDWWSALVEGVGEGGSDRQVGAAVGWIGSNARSLQYALAAGAGVLLVLWNHPTGLVILLFVLVTLAAIAGVGLIAGVAARASSGSAASPSESETSVPSS